MRGTSSVTVRVPAKVNLQLSVGPRRDDGYHDLVTVFQAVSLYDELELRLGRAGSGVSLTVEGEGAGDVPTDESNLAWRAVALVAERTGLDPDLRIHVRKGIPVAGGMAGGSADAAAALVACDALWHLGLHRAELEAMGAELGSDVPFSLHGGTAIGTGRGEQLTPALARGEFHWVFALAEGGLPTPAVYAECDRQREGEEVPPPRLSDALMAALRAADPVALGGALRNDLQPAAISLRPSLDLVLEVGDEYGALGGVVSGSGPTCAFLVADDEQALDLAVALSASGVCRTVRRASGPVPGARVVDAAG